jgi:hypothetical protein
MRPMTSRLCLGGLVGLILALAMGVSACSDKSGADKFVGTWTYAGAINPNCQNIAAIDLTGDTVTITATDSSHVRVDLAGYCMVNFSVDGFNATADSGQSCTFPIPGLGDQTITITTWTMMMTGDNAITSNFTGAILICAPTGMGTLTRQGDAGTSGG